MQNTSTVGIPKNCMNWLVLGLTIYTDMEIKREGISTKRGK